MVDIVTNERTCAEYAIRNSKFGAKPTETIGRVARYYADQGYDKGEIKGLIEDFMLKCDSAINLVKWQTTLERIVKSTEKYKLIEIDEISITQNEVVRIQALRSKMLQKLVFTMLCLAKYGNAINDNNNNWVNRKDKDIFNLANVKTTTKRQSLMINDLWTMGYIGYSRVVDNVNINVKFVDDESPTVLYITDFRNLGNQYMRYCGESFVECECCGILVKENHGRQRYCAECAKQINREKTLRRYHEENHRVV